MTDQSRELMQRFPIRKTGEQKEAFRAWLQCVLRETGKTPRVEQAGKLIKSHNVVLGDPDTAKVLLTAHYDTCSVLPVPNFITPRSPVWFLLYQLLMGVVMFMAAFLLGFAGARLWERAGVSDGVGMILTLLVVYAILLFIIWWMMGGGKANRHNANDNTSGVVTLLELALAMTPEQRRQVCFVWFDNEEKGLFGSAAFAKAHPRAKKEALVLNFDCVGDGPHIHFFPGKKVKRDRRVMAQLQNCWQPEGDRTVTVVEGFGLYPSDQRAFGGGVGVCALKHSKIFGYYMDRIHTGRDTVLQEENIHLLCRGALALTDQLTEKETTHAE